MEWGNSLLEKLALQQGSGNLDPYFQQSFI
jgi:hypothetical protein